MTTLAACFQAERVKWRKNWPLLVAILAPVCQVAFLLLLVWFSEDRVRVFKPGFLFWIELNAMAWNLVVMPIMVALICELSWGLEGDSKAWNHLLAQPVPLRIHYLVKLLSHFSLVLLAWGILQLLLPLGGAILQRNTFYSQLMVIGPLPWQAWLCFAAFSLAALLPLVAFQTWFSMRFPGLWGALALAAIGTMVCIQLVKLSPWVQVLPWGLSSQMAMALERLRPIPWSFLPGGLLAGVVLIGLGVWGFQDARGPRVDR